jgi:hypothetical protein
MKKPIARKAPPVTMTPEQQRRQDMQVRWLMEAVSMQHRSPSDMRMDPASLSLPQGPAVPVRRKAVGGR